VYLSYRHQQGVSLIESMIALLVISIGLLGIAALQITAMKQNNSALQHSQSVWIAYDIADRIRANFGEFNNYAGIDTNNTYAQDCITSACTSTQLITSDAQNWARRVQNLPSGRGLISSPAATQIRIRVMWDDEGTGATGTQCGTDPAVDLTCFSVTMVQ
jgi:type IV pilus assembly protein PilV